MTNDLVFRIQRDYPRIYLACHVDHVRARTSPHGISSRDASLLAHLDASEAQTAGALAAHLGIEQKRAADGLALLAQAASALSRKKG